MFTIDPSCDKPIMLLNKQIGKTTLENGEWDGVPYIDGAEFQEELMWLDTMGKTSIGIYINCPGGSVMQAANIFSAILKTKTPVDTYNVGLCASAAGLVFMAGRKRYMADYAQFMMHPVGSTNGEADGEADVQAAQAFTDMCSKMLAGKSNLTPELVSYLMSVTTWLNAEQCQEKGICTDIEATSDANRKGMPTPDVSAMLAFSNNILQTTFSNLKHKQMDFTKITNALGIVENSNEAVILAAITNMSEAKAAADQALQAAKDEAAALQAQLDAANQKIADAEAAQAAAEQEAADVAAESAATDLVNSFANKIGTATDAIAEWKNKAKTDFEGTKKLLELLPLNKAGVRATNVLATGAPKKNVEAIMMEIRNRAAVK